MGVFSTRSFWIPLLLATLVAAFFGAVLARRGRGLRDLLAERARLQAEIQRLNRQNQRLRAQRDALLSSPEAIERVAREEYGFAAPGEIVDEFESDAPAAPPPRASVGEGSPWTRMLSRRDAAMILPAATFIVTAVVLALWNLAAAAVRRPAGRGRTTAETDGMP